MRRAMRWASAFALAAAFRLEHSGCGAFGAESLRALVRAVSRRRSGASRHTIAATEVQRQGARCADRTLGSVPAGGLRVRASESADDGAVSQDRDYGCGACGAVCLRDEELQTELKESSIATPSWRVPSRGDSNPRRSGDRQLPQWPVRGGRTLAHWQNGGLQPLRR